MDIPTLQRYLDAPQSASAWLRRLGLADVKRGHANLMRMAESGMTLDLLADLCGQLEEHLPGSADPDMALNNLEGFVTAARSPIAVGTFFQRGPGVVARLVQIFSTSQHFSDLLIADQESVDLLQLTGSYLSPRDVLVEDLVAEVDALDHDAAVLMALRRFKRRETLRIAYGDIVHGHDLRAVTGQISFLADAILEAAVRVAWRTVGQQRGTPMGPDGKRGRFVVLGMGKLGGLELNYSSDIDLIFLYDGEGRTDGERQVTNREFFETLAREVVRLLTERTKLGNAYRVDLRLRPDGRRGPMVSSLQGALAYYDLRGRTWERQAYIKARPVAGDLRLGREFLRRLTPWIYGRYLSRADISGIKALKRRLEQQTRKAGADQRNVKTGHGGIRDVEFVIQFLQLLHGGDLPEVRTGNTLEAILRLERVGCLGDLESTLLRGNYRFLRKIEHRLQIMFDLQTHMLPDGPDELRKLALRMGYSDRPDKTDKADGADRPGRSALEAFEADYRSKTRLNRKILDHLLHDAFSDDVATEAEVDLVLDPDPPEGRIAEVLGRYGFRDVHQAYRHLMALSEEKIRFLSTRRCRQFLAAIAPELLRAVAATPDPDGTLVTLDAVSDSLGGKGVLWELFSFNPPSLKLCVELCAYSPYLCGILISNPGMIDGLLDGLVLDMLPARGFLEQSLAELCRAAEDLDPILHSFKNDQQLRVGVRDLLGKEDVQATTGTLSDIAEVCLGQIAAREYQRLVGKFGRPRIGEGSASGRPCEMILLAMGKFGGREMYYHSDLDLVFLYEAEGQTAPDASRDRKAFQGTTNQHFFSELAQRIIKATSGSSSHGRLYEIDARLRPTGRSGALATSLAEFGRYFAEGHGRLWERQALCKARVVYGGSEAARAAVATVEQAAFEPPWRRQHAAEIRHTRRRLEEAATASDLKRGSGGIVDIEFLVQMLQLKHGRHDPRLRVSSTLTALAALHEAGHLSAEDNEFFDANYRLLRTIEGRLRLMNSTARDKLPDDPTELAKLAHLVRYPSSRALLADYERAAGRIRRRFDEVFRAEETGRKGPR